MLLVTRHGLRPIVAGLLLGVLGSAGLHAVLTSSLVGVAAPALRVLAGISAALIGSMVLACFITALRVRATNPVDALRYE